MSGRVDYSPAFAMRAAPRTLIFLHIPKTGGTTFRRILESNYSPNEIRTLSGEDYSVDLELFAQSTETIRASYRAIQGHLYFGFHELIAGESGYITWMRDPIARALSFYSHVRTHPEHYLHRQLVAEQLDLKALIERKTTPELFNLQTRMIAGDRDSATSAVNRRTLEIAKENLERYFCFVGLTEQFDSGLLMLSDMLGWKVPFYIKRNVTDERIAPKNVCPETERLLRQANAFDFELYQFARNLFESRRKAAGGIFESKLGHFQRLNSVVASAQYHYGRMKTALHNAMGPR